jgi:ABC-2 type transport system permease protein
MNTLRGNMSGLSAAIGPEVLKLRRSKTPLVSALAFAFIAFICGFMMLLLGNQELANRLGILTTKAQLTIKAADWPTYLGLLAQATAGGGLALFGLLITWMFGREYSDHTAKDLLALPTARRDIILAKFLVAACWSGVLLLVLFVVALLMGVAIGLPGGSAEVLQRGMGILALTGLLTILLALPFAWSASAGRGYLPSVGCMLLAIALAQVCVGLGWGAYFPWAVGLVTSAGGPQPLGPLSYGLVILTCVAGIAGTLAWWQSADQT